MAQCRTCGTENPYSFVQDGSREAWQHEHNNLYHADHEHDWNKRIPQELLDRGLYLWVQPVHDMLFCQVCLLSVTRRDLERDRPR